MNPSPLARSSRIPLHALPWVALLVLGASASSAGAQVWVDANDLQGRLPDWVDPAYVKPEPVRDESYRRSRVWVEPVYRTVWTRCWCEPVYRPVCRRVWRPPVTETVYERVYVPARYAWREVMTYDAYGNRVVRREYVCVEPARWETRAREVVVRPGCWETIEERVVVSEGRYEDRPVRELVSAGRWEWR